MKKAKLKYCAVDVRANGKRYMFLDHIQFIFVDLRETTDFVYERTYFAHLN